MLNPHHLELFYYVARHGGISAAVRHIPYGVQQPAVSLQIVRLEEALNCTLFHRRPFALTEAGQKLFAHVRPFFEGLGSLEEELRGGADMHLRIGAAEIFQRDHLPAALARLRKRHPAVRFTLRESALPVLLDHLRVGEMDVVIGLVEGAGPKGVTTLPLARFQPALIVATALRLKTAGMLWAQDRIRHPLLCLPAHEALSRAFQSGLAGRGVVWEPAMELASLPLVERYAAEGFGIGVTFAAPGKKAPVGTRLLPLEDFPRITVAAFWNGRATSLKAALLEEIVAQAARIRGRKSGDAVGGKL